MDQNIGYHLPTVINQVSLQVGGGGGGDGGGGGGDGGGGGGGGASANQENDAVAVLPQAAHNCLGTATREN